MSGNAIVVDSPVRASPRRWTLAAATLLLACLVSALAVVYSVHRGRQTFVGLEALRREENRLQEEWRQLLLERSALAAHARVERLARTRLSMRPLGDAMQVVSP